MKQLVLGLLRACFDSVGGTGSRRSFTADSSTLAYVAMIAHCCRVLGATNDTRKCSLATETHWKIRSAVVGSRSQRCGNARAAHSCSALDLSTMQ